MNQDTITLLVLIGVGAVMLVSMLAFGAWVDVYRVVRRRVRCPARGTEAIVDFLTDARGPVIYRDVVDCSLIPAGAVVGCGKECRSTSVAPFGKPIGENEAAL